MALSGIQQLRQFHALPTLPKSVDLVRKKLREPQVGVREIGDLLARDPALAANVLRLANSAFYSLAEKTLDIRYAASVLGLQSLTAVVLRTSLLGGASSLNANEIAQVEALWRHSHLAAGVAEWLASESRRRATDLSPATYYTAGLLHDVGRIVLIDQRGSSYLELMARAGDDHAGLQLEHRELGFDHASVGAATAREWQFPETIVSAIARHHSLERIERDDVGEILMACDDVATVVTANPGADPQTLARKFTYRTIPIALSRWVELVRWTQAELRAQAA